MNKNEYFIIYGYPRVVGTSRRYGHMEKEAFEVASTGKEAAEELKKRAGKEHGLNPKEIKIISITRL
jgi:hypothetical protein